MFARVLKLLIIGASASSMAIAVRSEADYSDISRRSDAELKALRLRPVNVRPLAPAFEEPSGFRVGGTNATELLQTLVSLNGIAIEKLEANMRPGALSDVGFLGPDESLLDVLAADNDTVRALGFSHRRIGFHLRVLGELGIIPERERFSYRGERFRVERADTHGFQASPFEDETRDGRNATVTNLASGKSLSYALLVPKMIERYGFYEGFETPYRVDPKRAVEVLGSVLDGADDSSPAPVRFTPESGRGQ